MIVLFTDLDGTLLDSSTYSADGAREALGRAELLGVPVVFCSSKTRAEVEFWRRKLENRHPYIVENGGALYIPPGYFATPVKAPASRDGFEVFEFGRPYGDLVRTLREASKAAGCRVLGFHDLSPAEVSRRYGLSLEQAGYAKQREYDEPFEILDPPGSGLLAEIEARKARWIRGGRLYHVTGINDKAHCVLLLSCYYGRSFGPLKTVGLGDGMNDARFLASVDVPIVVGSAAATKLKRLLPHARVTERSGSAGWNGAVLETLAACSGSGVIPRAAAGF